MYSMAKAEIKNLRATGARGGPSIGTASTEIISENISEMSESEVDRNDIPFPREVDASTSKSTETDIAAVISEAQIDMQNKMEDVRSQASVYYPIIKRGFDEDEKKDDAPEVAMAGWKHDIACRREREESLRDEVRVFASKVRKTYPLLEGGIEVTLWQLNKSTEVGVKATSGEEFKVKSSTMTLTLHRRGDLLVQSELTFSSAGGYLSKALGRRRSRVGHEPLPLSDILEVKAGCVGFDNAQLPSASSKKGKTKVKSENLQSGLFVTIKAAPTPMATSRSYFLRFKARSTRDDLLYGLRGVLADLQVHEGVSVSRIMTPADSKHARRMPGSAPKNTSNPFLKKRDDVMVPLSDVHDLVNKERESYDRLLLTMLQGSSDLKEKEDQLLSLRGRLHKLMAQAAEKDKTQANDSKLIMQLSKKLETLLMENEDLRDSNDRLNQRLVHSECEKMNLKK